MAHFKIIISYTKYLKELIKLTECSIIVLKLGIRTS